MLYVCPTPIGNLEDITLRALRVLREVDLVLAEDTRHTGQLLHHFQIQQPLESLHEHNEREKAARILDLLAQGKKVALVSDAGMPGISDPGAFLIREVIGAGARLEVLHRGECGSGGFAERFRFALIFSSTGFFPGAEKDRLRTLETLERLSTNHFHEAPHRLRTCLRIFLHVLGDRPISISRSSPSVLRKHLAGFHR